MWLFFILLSGSTPTAKAAPGPPEHSAALDAQLNERLAAVRADLLATRAEVEVLRALAVDQPEVASTLLARDDPKLGALWLDLVLGELDLEEAKTDLDHQHPTIQAIAARQAGRSNLWAAYLTAKVDAVATEVEAKHKSARYLETATTSPVTSEMSRRALIALRIQKQAEALECDAEVTRLQSLGSEDRLAVADDGDSVFALVASERSKALVQHAELSARYLERHPLMVASTARLRGLETSANHAFDLRIGALQARSRMAKAAAQVLKNAEAD
jgi:hypothetical protein